MRQTDGSTTKTTAVLALGCILALGGTCLAQNTPAPSPAVGKAPGTRALDTSNVAVPPATDPGAQLDVPASGSKDRSAVESPVPPAPSGTVIPVGTQVKVTITDAVSSGTALNGAPVHAVLADAVRTRRGEVLQAGTPVLGTVVSSAPAGKIQSGGVLSVQLTHVGPAAVVTDVRDFTGPQGHRDVADSAPAKGGEAQVAAGAQLQFQVLETGNVPGIIPGIAPAKNAGGNKGGGGQKGSAPNGSANGIQNGQVSGNQGSPATAHGAPGNSQEQTPAPGSSASGAQGQNVAPTQQAAPGAINGVTPPSSASPTGRPH